MARKPGRRPSPLLIAIAAVVIAGVVGTGLFFGLRSRAVGPMPVQNQQVAAAQGPLHIQGGHLVDSTGQGVLIRGAQIQGYNVQRTYKTTTWFSAAAFAAMRSWGMNEVRIPFSACLVTGDPQYLPGLQAIAQRAEAAGLYVVLAMFGDARAGCAVNGVAMPHASALQQWSRVAAAFSSDTSVIFDLYNEPHPPDGLSAAAWALWKTGGIATSPSGDAVAVAGMDQLAAAIRAAGARSQVLVAEMLGTDSITADPTHEVVDANVLYSLHTYFARGATTTGAWDRMFGTASAQLPVYIGEWAFLPNGQYPEQCSDLRISTADATSLVNGFMRYMEAHGVSYNVWSFTPTHLIVDEARFAPTTLPDPMQCDTSLTNAGIGSLYKSHLHATA